MMLGRVLLAKIRLRRAVAQKAPCQLLAVLVHHLRWMEVEEVSAHHIAVARQTKSMFLKSTRDSWDRKRTPKVKEVALMQKYWCLRLILETIIGVLLTMRIVRGSLGPAQRWEFLSVTDKASCRLRRGSSMHISSELRTEAKPRRQKLHRARYAAPTATLCRVLPLSLAAATSIVHHASRGTYESA